MHTSQLLVFHLGPVAYGIQVHSAVYKSHGQLTSPCFQAVCAQCDRARYLCVQWHVFVCVSVCICVCVRLYLYV